MGHHRAKQIGLEHCKKNLRECDHNPFLIIRYIIQLVKWSCFIAWDLVIYLEYKLRKECVVSYHLSPKNVLHRRLCNFSFLILTLEGNTKQLAVSLKNNKGILAEFLNSQVSAFKNNPVPTKPYDLYHQFETIHVKLHWNEE